LRALALLSFREAALANPANTEAAFNLEVLQTQLARRREDVGPGSGGDQPGESGAGATPAGEGF
jgi:hypothetical protein